jgi:general secretion pathway protein A
LIGQPELQQLLKRNELRQLAQRITARYHLLPLNSSEVVAYIGHRLGVANGDINVFSKATIRAAFDITGGIPRVINLLCDRALTLTFTKQLAVVPLHIFMAAAQQILGEDVVQQRQGKRWTYTLLAMFLVTTALGFVIGRFNA